MSTSDDTLHGNYSGYRRRGGYKRGGWEAGSLDLKRGDASTSPPREEQVTLFKRTNDPISFI